MLGNANFFYYHAKRCENLCSDNFALEIIMSLSQISTVGIVNQNGKMAWLQLNPVHREDCISHETNTKY